MKIRLMDPALEHEKKTEEWREMVEITSTFPEFSTKNVRTIFVFVHTVP